MYDLASDHDPIGPADSALLADAGLDGRAIGEALAHDRAMRCPDRDTVLRGGADAVRDTAMPVEGLHETGTG